MLTRKPPSAPAEIIPNEHRKPPNAPQRYGHNQIDTEHILLALIEQPGGVIPQILEKLSVSAEALTERLDATLRASPKANIFGGGAGQIFITPRVKRIIDLANEEANRLKDEYISTEHIFLAILTERNTPAARILESAGLTRDRVYDAIQDLRGGQRVTDPQAERATAPWKNTHATSPNWRAKASSTPSLGAITKFCA
jgi:ATP-dependent Clp protease ATP-binding subunit ClpC